MISLLLALALAGQDDPVKQDIDNAIKRLSAQGSLDSFAARLELEEIGRRAVPALVAELGRSEANAAAKRAACEALGRIRDPHKDAVAALIGKLKDADEYGESVAAAAARALGLIGDPAAGPALLDVLKSKAVDTDKVLKAETIKALGILRTKEAVELLRKALEDKKTASVAENDDVAPLVAAAAADALGQLRAKEAVDDLSAKLSDATNNPATTQTLGVHAARALQRILAADLKAGDARANTLTGTAEEITKTMDAWKKWSEGAKAKKDIDETKSRLAKIAAAVEAYKKDQGKLPTVLDYLVTKQPDVKTWPEKGYYQGELKDAWGRGLYYRAPGTGAEYDIVSYGKDGAAWGSGDDADLFNHDKWIEAKKAETKKAIDETVKVIQQFKADQDRLPEKLVDLVFKPPYTLKKEWPKDGYLKEGPKDGFGFELKYKQPGTGGEPFDLLSLGADRKEGGEGVDADVWNHDKRPAPPKEEPKKDEPKK